MKKKGLIVATIVMVLVLAVSLTTATYAWFSSTAAVTVEHLSINAEATEGLEIAIKTTQQGTPAEPLYTTGYTYGSLTYSPATGYWGSDEEFDGFGSTLDFTAIEVGKISNAVTNDATNSSIPEGAQYVYTKDTSVTTTVTANHYKIDASGKPTQCEAGAAESETDYYTRAAVESGTFYVPTGYDENVQPYGFFAVNPNGHGTYYDLPIRVKSTTDVKAIVCSLKINSQATGVFAPGMAAATRIQIGFGVNNGAEQTYTDFTPYSSATSTVSGMQNVVPAESELAFVVAYALNANNVSSANVYTVHVILWVEGTDPECNNYTTSSTNFSVDFSFKYSKDTISSTPSTITVDSKAYTVLTNYTQVVSA